MPVAVVITQLRIRGLAQCTAQIGAACSGEPGGVFV